MGEATTQEPFGLDRRLFPYFKTKVFVPGRSWNKRENRQKFMLVYIEFGQKPLNNNFRSGDNTMETLVHMTFWVVAAIAAWSFIGIIVMLFVRVSCSGIWMYILSNRTIGVVHLCCGPLVWICQGIGKVMDDAGMFPKSWFNGG